MRHGDTKDPCCSRVEQRTPGFAHCRACRHDIVDENKGRGKKFGGDLCCERSLDVFETLLASNGLYLASCVSRFLEDIAVESDGKSVFVCVVRNRTCDDLSVIERSSDSSVSREGDRNECDRGSRSVWKREDLAEELAIQRDAEVRAQRAVCVEFQSPYRFLDQGIPVFEECGDATLEGHWF